jgi:hypothetical protein
MQSYEMEQIPQFRRVSQRVMYSLNYMWVVRPVRRKAIERNVVLTSSESIGEVGGEILDGNVASDGSYGRWPENLL